MRRLFQLPDEQVNNACLPPRPHQRTKHAPRPSPLHQGKLCWIPLKEDTKASNSLKAEGNESTSTGICNSHEEPANSLSALDGWKNLGTGLCEQVRAWEAGLRLSSGETSPKTRQPGGAERSARKLAAWVARKPESQLRRESREIHVLPWDANMTNTHQMEAFNGGGNSKRIIYCWAWLRSILKKFVQCASILKIAILGLNGLSKKKKIPLHYYLTPSKVPYSSHPS